MRKLDIATLRHPTSESETNILSERESCVVIVSPAQYAENMRIAQERFIRMQLENCRPL
ncbi:MAG: hypothetical protein J5742_03930 [Alphaproteobacteria bacterium]|nr:hypothetical protein [Alphaproteobacteria bacterium]